MVLFLGASIVIIAWMLFWVIYGIVHGGYVSNDI